MFQQESIYNLVPQDLYKPKKDPLYVSQYPKDLIPTGTTFGLLCSSYPGSANHGGGFNLPRGAHPTNSLNKTFGKPNGFNTNDRENFLKKGHQYINYPQPEKLRSHTSNLRKPGIPTLEDKPIMGLKSDKNYVTSNAVDIILMTSKKKIKEERDFLTKRNYGKVPQYLENIKQEIANEYHTIRQTQIKQEEAEARKKRNLDEDEIGVLKEGLNKKLLNLKKEYGVISHKTIFDTLVTKRNKERLEGQIEVIEKDIAKLNKGKVIVDMTRY